ncbi:MAG TPA: maleylpyruvate isomerase family mycothiol-dependent enzyme [Streptosporangiaceae bacterium]
MRVFDLIVGERRYAAGLFAGLTDDQLARPSLCEAWTMHEVAAHLTTFLRFGQVKLYLGILATAADIDRVNLWLTRRAARRPIGELVEILRAGAAARTTIPRSGYDPVLTDLVLHDLDVRRPLGIQRESRGEEALWVAFNHMARQPSPGFTMGSRLRDLRLVAADTGWTYGRGPLVRGDVDDLLLAMGGRAVALDALDGDGVPVLRRRLTTATRSTAVRRVATVLDVLVHPQPPERRSRQATGS